MLMDGNSPHSRIRIEASNFNLSSNSNAPPTKEKFRIRFWMRNSFLDNNLTSRSPVENHLRCRSKGHACPGSHCEHEDTFIRIDGSIVLSSLV